MSLLSKNKKKDKYISFNGKKYALNLEKLKEVCLTPSNENGGREFEVTQVYEPDGSGDFNIASRVEHETKTSKVLQNDMIVYDIVKLLILAILENNNVEDEFRFDFSTVFAVNTLINWGILEEKDE